MSCASNACFAVRRKASAIIPSTAKPETVKGETCAQCRKYLKILYQVKDHELDPLSDDVASLDLDMLLAAEGWQRGGHNLFLLGY